jgi:hypothetical protein
MLAAVSLEDGNTAVLSDELGAVDERSGSIFLGVQT